MTEMIRSGHVQFHGDLAKSMVDIDSVQCHPENYNCGDVDGIMESIVTNGMYRPIYIQRSTGFIIAGNHTWMACKELGAEVVPVSYVDCDDAQAMVILLADNEYAKKAKADYGQMVKIAELVQSTVGLMGSGVTDQELEQLKALVDTPLDPEPSDFGQWPSLCFQVPPHVKRHFLEMTSAAGGDTERFMLIMRLAGWDGKK